MDGKNIEITYRFAEGSSDRLAAHAVETLLRAGEELGQRLAAVHRVVPHGGALHVLGRRVGRPLEAAVVALAQAVEALHGEAAGGHGLGRVTTA